MSPPVLDLTAVLKDYRGLRPLRIRELTLRAGEQTALMGLDQVAAEVLVNLITGATLPDQGQVRVFGRPTSDIADSDAWLAAADRFGIVSDRIVLLDALSAIQNLAMPFSLEIEPPSAVVEAQAVGLADEVGLAPTIRIQHVGRLGPLDRTKVRLGRALAFNPEVLLVEHPTAGLPRGDVAALAHQVRRVAEARAIAALIVTADREFADAAATRVLSLEPATGRIRASGRRLFSW